MSATALLDGKRYLRVGGRRIRRYYRREFLENYWHYKPGQHVAFIAPTQDGKTTLAFQLMMYTPHIRPLVFVMKPRDATPAAWSRALGFQEVPAWPPPPRWPWQKEPPGYTLWPPHAFIAEVDDATLSREFRKALDWSYQQGDCIVFADEIYGMVAELDGLTRPLIALWTRGSGMGAGVWAATQRPAGSQGKGVPGHMYSNSQHLFLSRDPDEASRKRYGEIGGVDRRLVEAAVMKLRKYEFLYINKGDEAGGPYLAIIEAR